MPKFRRPDPSTLALIQAGAALTLVFAGVSLVSLPAALLLTGLLLWHDVTSPDGSPPAAPGATK